MSILSLLEGKGPKEVGELMLSDVPEFVRLKVKGALDSLLEGEIEAMFTEAFLAKNKDFRNGYYYRHLKTSEGVIEVRVPR